MGDVGDYWNAAKEEDRERREANAAKAPQQIGELKGLGHTVTVLSQNGPHLRVNADIHYWPSTGRWKPIRGRGGGRGFESLKTALAARKPPQRVVRYEDEDGRSHRGRRASRAQG